MAVDCSPTAASTSSAGRGRGAGREQAPRHGSCSIEHRGGRSRPHRTVGDAAALRASGSHRPPRRPRPASRTATRPGRAASGTVLIGELAARFALGGAVVCIFAVCGELFTPKTFAGLFGAAPSVAIATLAIAYARRDAGYVALESRSMVLGAAAFLVYGLACVAATERRRLPVWLGTGLAWGAWAAVALGVWSILRATGEIA